MAAISLKVNGRDHAVDVDPETPLLYVLGDELQLRGPKFGSASRSAAPAPCSSRAGQCAHA